jgi:hypothetical protein
MMARLYMACGDYEKAQPLAERALRLARAKAGSDSEPGARQISTGKGRT